MLILFTINFMLFDFYLFFNRFNALLQALLFP